MRQHEKDSERGAVRCTILVAEYPRAGAESETEVETATDYLFQHGIMLGDSNGEMASGVRLTRPSWPLS